MVYRPSISLVVPPGRPETFIETPASGSFLLFKIFPEIREDCANEESAKRSVIKRNGIVLLTFSSLKRGKSNSLLLRAGYPRMKFM